MPFGRANVVSTGKDGQLDGTTAADFDDMFTAMAAADRVVLHFHGGLVSHASGMNTAKRLYSTYSDAGAYPVFFVWSSGLLEVLEHNLGEIAGESIFKTLQKWILKYAVGKVAQPIGTKGIGGLMTPRDLDVALELGKLKSEQEPYGHVDIPDGVEPLSDAEEAAFRQDLGTDAAFQASAQAIANSVIPPVETAGAKGVTTRVRTSEHTLMSPDVVDELAKESQASADQKGIFGAVTLVKKAGEVLVRVINRYRDHNDHGLYPTVVEEILREFYLANVGAAVWGAMKKETSDTFQHADPVRGGDEFMRRLTAMLAAGHAPQFDLVGHSTGAVFIDNMLTAVEQRRADPNDPFPADFKFHEIAFLAPANRFSEFADLVTNRAHLYDGFRMFTMSDAAESSDHLVGVLYPRSLLYFISGVLELDANGKSGVEPIVGMQRYYPDAANSTFPDVVTIGAFVNQQADRAVWSPANDGDGRRSSAMHHSDFDEDKDVLASLQFMIEH